MADSPKMERKRSKAVVMANILRPTWTDVCGCVYADAKTLQPVLRRMSSDGTIAISQMSKDSNADRARLRFIDANHEHLF